MRSYDCASNSILCIYGILPFLYLVLFRWVVIIPVVVTALTPIIAVVSNTLYYTQDESHCCDKDLRSYDCASNSILCVYGILPFLYLVSFKWVVIIPVIFTTLTPINTVVCNMLCY